MDGSSFLGFYDDEDEEYQRHCEMHERLKDERRREAMWRRQHYKNTCNAIGMIQCPNCYHFLGTEQERKHHSLTNCIGADK